MPLTDAGYVAKTGTEILDDIRARYSELTEETPDWDEDDFLGVWSVVMAERLASLEDGQLELYNAGDISTASGRALEKICANALVFRREATASRVDLALDGSPGAFVPAGKIVECTANGARFVTLEDVTLPGTTVAESLTKGPIAGPASTITEIVTPVSGWTTATNAAAATLGNTVETDSSLRRRYFDSLQQGTSVTINGILGVVGGLSFVDAALAVENTTLTAQTVGGISLPGKSWAVIVAPSVLTAAEQTQLSEALLSVAPFGIEVVGTESAVVVADNGQSFTMYWNYATEVAATVVVSYNEFTGEDQAEIEADIESVVSGYFASLRVGDDVRNLPLCQDISGITGVYGASVTINGGANLVIGAGQVASLASVSSSSAGAIDP